MQLEASIKALPGVLGCVILSTPEGLPTEIQAFTDASADRVRVERAVLEEVGRRGLSPGLRQVLVFELEAESHVGDRESLVRAAELAEQEARARGPLAVPEAPLQLPGAASRPPLVRVDLRATSVASEARVTLGGDDEAGIEGRATGEKTPHGLRVMAEATLEAVAKVLPGTRLTLKGASLATILGRECVLALVQVEPGFETLGAALVRGGPVAEAAVRATLDAVNRRLDRRA